jgi:hypothetical protein
MNRTLLLPAIAVFINAPAIAGLPDAQTILQTMREKQIERWNGVDRYVVQQTVLGNTIQLLYERVAVKDADGHDVPAFRLVPATEAKRRSQEAKGQHVMTTDEMRVYADTMDGVGNAMSSEIENGMEAAGLPPGLLKATGSDPWATFDPATMLGGNATMFRMTADGLDAEAAGDDGSGAAQQDVTAIATIGSRARVVGIETIDGRAAYHLRANDLNEAQKADDREFVVQSVDLWIDRDMYVMLRSRANGIARSANETKPMSIEQQSTDYRSIPGSQMYEPYKRVLKMAGLMDAKQEQEMHQAQVKMAEFEQQLAEMPPAQRQMVMNQMGPQIESMKSMAASGGGYQMVTTVDAIRVGELPDETPTTTRVMGAELPATAFQQQTPATSPPMVPSTPQRDAATLRTAQQACLKQKMQQAEAAKKKKHGLGSLFGAITRTASRYGVADLSRANDEIYNANATANDVATAAKDLGLTEDDVAECRDPHTD